MIYYIDNEERKLVEEEMIINAFYSSTPDFPNNLFSDYPSGIDNTPVEEEKFQV